MAYFGGTTSERPWSRIDLRFFALLVLASAGIITSLVMGRNIISGEVARETAKPQAQPEQAVPQEAAILVSNQEIPAGKPLHAGMFRIEVRRVAGIQDSVVKNIDDINGSMSRVAIANNTPLLKQAFSNSQNQPDITVKIPTGYRAVAIPVNVVTGVEGWVRPGARVDVVWSTTHLGRSMVTTIVENAQVLSAERSLDPNMPEAKSAQAVPNHITLLATMKDAQKIQLAKNSGSLSLSLRGYEDGESVGSETIGTDSLLTTSDSTMSDIQGKISVGGESFVLKSGKLVPESELGRKK